MGSRGTVECLDNDVGAAAAAEDAEGVDFSVGGDAGADLHGLELFCGELAVVAGEGAAVGVHTVACRGAGHVGAVAAGGAVEWVAVGGLRCLCRRRRHQRGRSRQQPWCG